MTKYIVLGILVILGLPLLFGSWFTVQSGYVGLVKDFGQVRQEAFEPGLHFKTPYVSSVVKIDVQTQKVEVVSNAASKDLQSISATIAVNYTINATKARDVYVNYGGDEGLASRVIAPSIQEAIKGATAKYTAEELITKRSQVSGDMKQILIDKITPTGATVSDVNIINFEFSQQFDAAIEAKVRAEQDAITAKNKLVQVQAEAQQAIEKAKAEAESIRIQAEAITKQGGKELVELKKIEVQLETAKRWNGALPTTILGDAPIPFISIGK